MRAALKIFVGVLAVLCTASLLISPMAGVRGTSPNLKVKPDASAPADCAAQRLSEEDALEAVYIPQLISSLIIEAAGDVAQKDGVTKDFLIWCAAALSEGADILPRSHSLAPVQYRDPLAALMDDIGEKGYGKGVFHRLFGISLAVLKDEYALYLNPGALDGQKIIWRGQNAREDITLSFTGDICLADNWYMMKYFEANHKLDVNSAISEKLLSRMRESDILLVNCEFTFSDSGTPLNKAYTFRAKPEHVKIFGELGADIVSLANNHSFDYGKEAFFDTLEILNSANISYMGAGADIAEAGKPVYYVINGFKIAFTAATRAEKNIITPRAGENSPGVFYTYDPKAYCDVIAEASANSDFTIAYVHWGTEYSTTLETAQITQGKMYAEAGADLVVGSHSHCLQGVDIYNGTPIIYGLGNFWFNGETLDTVLLAATLSKDLDCTAAFYPCIQTRGGVTDTENTANWQRILSYISGLSPNVTIDGETGVIGKAS